MHNAQSLTLPVFLALMVVQFLFGINYVISKVIVDVFPPLAWAHLRMLLSAIILLVIVILMRRPHPPFSKKFFMPLIIFSLLGVIINQATFLVGLHYTTSTNSAILNTLIPVFTLIVVTLRGQESFTINRVLGFGFALSGVLVLRKVEDFTLSNKTLLGDFLTVINCMSYAVFLSISKEFTQKYDNLWITVWLFIYGSIGLGFGALPDWSVFQAPQISNFLIGCMAFNIIGATILTYLLNVWTLSKTRSSYVALFIYVQPVFASLLNWIWYDQMVTTRIIISWLLILTGMVLAIYANGRGLPIQNRA